MSSHKSKPTIPGFSERFSEYRRSGTPEYAGSGQPDPRLVQHYPHSHPAPPPGYPPSGMMPRAMSPTAGAPPYPHQYPAGRPITGYPPAPGYPAAGYPPATPGVGRGSSQHPPYHASSAPAAPGGQFSILRASHSGGQPLSTASSSTTYDGLSGTVRPLRQNEYSQYAVEGAGQAGIRYECPICHKNFDRPSGLRIHMNSHSGAKPFQCTQPGCSRSFSVRSNLYRHERSHHGGGGQLTGDGQDADDEEDEDA